jgi:quercetin dioxygenase-like cupin family protein
MSSRWLVLTAAACLAFTACSKKSSEPWRGANDQLIKKHNIVARARTIPQTDVPLGMEVGKAQPKSALPKVTIAPGVSATLAWGKGAMLEQLEMGKGAQYPSQQLNEEVITVVREGSATCDVGGKTLELPADSVLYLTPGATRSLRAGPDGMKALEVFSPVRVDLLKLAGVAVPDGAKVGFPDQGIAPSLNAGQVYRLSEIQLTPLTDQLPSVTYKRSAANSRLVWGKNVMLSFVRMDPNSYFPIHSHPEDQLMTLLRGSLVEGIMDVPFPMTEKDHNSALLPNGMVHDAKMGELGGDALDIFWPARTDYIAKQQKQQAAFEQVVAPDAKPVEVKGPVPAADSNRVHDAGSGAYVVNLAPSGAAKLVIPAGEYAMLKAGAISPDGKTFYVSNAGGQPGENFVYAYDIQADGSLANKRKFAMLNLTDSALSAPNPADRYNSGAGGMAVDTDGRVYVATALGVQIFDKAGLYVGNIFCPQYPVSVTFGGKNGDVLYLVGEKQVWSIQTKVKGFRLPAGMD